MCLFRVTRGVADFSPPATRRTLRPGESTPGSWYYQSIHKLLVGFQPREPGYPCWLCKNCLTEASSPDSVQKILAARICRRDGWEPLAGSPAIICQYRPWLHVFKCTVATEMLSKVKLISSMPDHATHEAGIASRCEPMPNLLGQSAT